MEAEGPLWRLRSAKNMMDEISYLQSSYGVTHISFLDDIFLAKDNRSRTRARELARIASEARMNIKFAIECRADAIDAELFNELAKAGLARVFVGIEAGDDETLRKYNKRTTVEQNRAAIHTLRMLNISIGLGFILFHADMTLLELRHGIDFLQGMKIATKQALCTRVDAYPGTPIWARLKKEGRLIGDDLAPKYRFANPTVEKAFEMFRALLAPLQEVDTLVLKAEFEITADEPRSRILREDRLNELRGQYSDSICRLATMLLNAIDPAVGDSAQEAQAVEEAKRFVTGVKATFAPELQRLRGTRHESTTYVEV